MSLDAMDWVWTNSQSKGVARLVMLAIADKTKGSSCKAFAGMTFLQERANAGRSTVVGAVRDLTESGELEVVEGETGPFGAAVYRLPKAIGYVRAGASTPGKSVQNLHRSSGGKGVRVSAEITPNTALADTEIGAETEPIVEPEALQAGADPAPIDAQVGLGIGADPVPNHQWQQTAIGADSGQQSVQILDNIGAGSAPPIHQTPKSHHKASSPAGVVALPGQRADEPRERNAMPTAQTFIGEWLGRYPEDDQPTRDIIGRIGRELKKLLADPNARIDDIRAGLEAWAIDGNSPNSLPSFVNGARNRRRKAEQGQPQGFPQNQRPSATTQRTHTGVALMHEFAAEEGVDLATVIPMTRKGISA